MQVAILYITTVLIWGSTWGAIKLQLGVVPEEVSVAYRFFIASGTLFLYGALAGRSLALPPARYVTVILQGVFLFCANYFFVYFATGYITSGLVAVLFTSLVFMNSINEWIFFRTPLEPRVIAAGMLGLSGIGLIFWPELEQFALDSDGIRGVMLLLAGVTMASLGNMAAIANTRRRLSVLAVNAHGMLWGACLSALLALSLGRGFTFEPTIAYTGSLLYLAIPGSAMAFGFYLMLMERIGAASAAYTTVLFPVVALLISTLFEGYQWSWLSAGGVALTLAGNGLALAGKMRTARGMAMEIKT